ncbi:MAG: hypothetical protein HFH14_08640 [Lachnospiraceae bacterium]|nr:hypothetical protein [Lachnospiraceae bacterium]
MLGKLDAKQSKIVLLILVAVVIVVAFRFGYTPISARVDEVAAENEELEGRLEELEYVRDNAEQYRTELNAALSGIEAIKQKFAAAITPQKSIMTLRELEKATDMNVLSISFDENENLYTSSFVNEAGVPVVINRSRLNVSYRASYEGLKKAVDFVNGYADYMNLESVASSYNQETGLLMGTMTINAYSLTGLGKVYEEPVIDGIGLSKDNIFGTMR